MWIQEYREREKLELWQFQQRVNTYGQNIEKPFFGVISADLIHMLEVDKNAVTHPRIADAIATLCNATPEQRDMIVAECHKCEWNGPTDDELEIARETNEKLFVKGIDYHQIATASSTSTCQEPKHKFSTASNKRPVVKIDVCGYVVKRYDSTKEAAESEHLERSAIKCRCQRKIKREFSINGIKQQPNQRFTYRYADDWDNMTSEQKMADIRKSIEAETKK